MAGFKSEFLLKSFGFYGATDEDIFSVKLGKIPVGVLLIWRLIFTLYLLGSTIASALINGTARFLIYLTNWTLIMLSLWGFVTLFLSTYYYFKTRKGGSNKNVFKSSVPRIVAWILFDIIFGASLLVTILFWAFLYTYETHGSTTEDAFRAWNGHLVNFLIPLIDFTYNRIPIRILHSVYPVIYGCIYLLFTAIYYVESKQYVYSILDWAGKPGFSTGIALASIVAVIIFQFIFYGLYRLKLRFISKKSSAVEHRSSNQVI